LKAFWISVFFSLKNIQRFGFPFFSLKNIQRFGFPFFHLKISSVLVFPFFSPKNIQRFVPAHSRALIGQQ